MLYIFCEYKLRNHAIQYYHVSANTDWGVGLAVWIWIQRRAYWPFPYVPGLCVLIMHHFEKLQWILHLENLETDLNEDKLTLRYLDKMTRSVQYAGIVGWLFVVS